jgi:glutamine synthetase
MDATSALSQAIADSKIQFIDLWFTDITGIVKNVTIPRQRAQEVIDNGIHFDGSSVEGFARVAESDMVLKPDPGTFAVFPWEHADGSSARMVCDVTTLTGEPFIGDPRTVLQRVLAEASSMGFAFKIGMELEFFLFHDRGADSAGLHPVDSSSYFDVSSDVQQSIIQKMMSYLMQMGIRVDSMHHEIGSGQFEIDLGYDHALLAADQLLTARFIIKRVAQEFGMQASFMPRPSMSLPGSGMHTHQSLHDLTSGSNVFADTAHQYGLSETARYFLAGQLAHVRAMSAVLSPLVNSYKRLGVSFEAPKYVAWGHVNRAGATVIRVPHIAPGREDHTRLELRCPDPAANPYLAAAVMLAAGLDGIRNRLPLPDALDESLLRQDRSRLRQLETLPASLDEALDELAQDDVILGALGPFISDRYLAAKRQELAEYHQQVTAWELERYLTRY